MDYTPISTRRMLMAFALTAFVALLPALYFLLESGGRGLYSLTPEADGGYRGFALGAESVVLTASLIAAFMLAVAAGRRMVRRPSRA